MKVQKTSISRNKKCKNITFNQKGGDAVSTNRRKRRAGEEKEAEGEKRKEGEKERKVIKRKVVLKKKSKTRNLFPFTWGENSERFIFRWGGGGEGAGVKENEIQIVTLEKQKDAYQVNIIDQSTNQMIRIDPYTMHDQEEYCQLST